MQDTANAKDLEDEMPLLRFLDETRSRSLRLQKESVKALRRFVSEPDFDTKEHRVHRAIAARVLLEHAEDDMARAVRKILDSLDWKPLEQIDYGILEIAQVLRAAVAAPALALSKGSFQAWYFIVREIYTAHDRDWVVGSARVNEKGWASAYVTSVCLKAALDLERALVRTAEFFDAVDEILKSAEVLDDPNIDRRWQEIEKSVIRASAEVTVAQLSKRTAIALEAPRKRDVVLDYLSGDKEGSLRHIAQCALDDVVLALESVIAEAEKFHTDEFPLEERSTDPKPGPVDEKPRKQALKEQELRRRRSESSTAHGTALESLKLAKLYADEALDAIKNFENERPRVAQVFRRVAAAVHDRVRPSHHYLSIVIDRQITAKSTEQLGKWEPAELAFAAATYCEYEPPRADDKGRLELAAKYLCDSVGSDGQAHPKKPFHHQEGSTMMIASTPFFLKAWTDVLRMTEMRLTEKIASKLLPYFEERQKIDARTGETRGWINEFGLPKAHPTAYSTANAVDTISTIVCVLDKAINGIVLKHFSVRRAGSGPGLDKLFYPDYGLAAMAANRDRDLDLDLPRATVAIEMQNMRAHILGAGVLEPLNSVVLYGPAGTGKTTLIEALAKTCKVPLVEVTPSDISKSGEDAVERHARVVFEALTLLTDAVVLFDEFDPVLRRRDPSGATPLNIFSFLTPGMLPKLKALNESAKSRRFAYALITNFIGTLDEAAVRQGRFDQKIGIYPPDPLSRLGYFCKLATGQCAAAPNAEKPLAVDEARLAEVVTVTGGLGMTALMAEGWFRGGIAGRVKDRPLDYVMSRCNKLIDMPAPEDRFVEAEGLRGKGQSAELEFLHWGLVHFWDEDVKNGAAASAPSADVLNTAKNGLTTALLKQKQDLEAAKAKAAAR